MAASIAKIHRDLDVRFGSLADTLARTTDVCFTLQ